MEGHASFAKISEVSRREGVSEMSLSNWRKQARAEGSVVSDTKQPSENWSAETKFAVVLETAGFSEIDLREYCRRKGLYPEQIATWRQSFINGQKAVGWEVYDEESGEKAAALLQRSVISEQCLHEPLVLHSDNGAPMKSLTLLS